MKPTGAYVYEHWRPDTGQCFYVGKGRGKRARDSTRNQHHKNVVAKLVRQGLNFEVRIIADSLSDAEAFALEVERIALWRSVGIRLANLTDGGDGPSNPTEEVRRKIREARKNQVLTEEHRAKHRTAMACPQTRLLMSLAAKSRPNNFAGRSHSEETKKAWSEKRRGVTLTAEHRAKISAALLINNGFKGKTHTEETKSILSSHAKSRDLSRFNFRGRQHSTDSKAKIRAALIGKPKVKVPHA